MKKINPFLIRKYNVNILPHLLLGFAWAAACAVGAILQYKVDNIRITSGLLLTEAARGLFRGILGTAASCGLWMVCTRKFCWTGAGKRKYSAVLHKQNVWFLWFCVCFSVCFLAYYPAIYSYDAQVQIEQWMTGNYSTHHPLIHTLLTGFAYQIGLELSKVLPFRLDGMVFYSFFQIAVLACSMSRAMKLLIHKKINDRVLIVVGMLFGLLPVHPLLSVIITKDVIFSALMLLQFVYLLELLDGKKAVPFVITSVLMMFFRNNGVYAVIGLVLTAVLFSIRSAYRKKILTAAALAFLSVGLFLGGSRVLNAAIDPVSGASKEMLSVPMQQLARTYKSHSQEMSAGDLEKLLYYIPEEGCQNYRQWLADPVKNYFSEEHFKEDPAAFFSFYLKMLRKYPSSFLTAALYQTMGYWYPLDVSHTRIYETWWRDRTGYLMTDAIPVFLDDYVVSENPVPLVRDYFEQFATECVQLKIPVIRLLFEPSFYCWNLFLIAGIALWRRQWKLVTALSPVVFYQLTSFAGPAVLVRYAYPLMLIVPFACVVLFVEMYGRKGGNYEENQL